MTGTATELALTARQPNPGAPSGKPGTDLNGTIPDPSVKHPANLTSHSSLETSIPLETDCLPTFTTRPFVLRGESSLTTVPIDILNSRIHSFNMCHINYTLYVCGCWVPQPQTNNGPVIRLCKDAEELRLGHPCPVTERIEHIITNRSQGLCKGCLWKKVSQ